MNGVRTAYASTVQIARGGLGSLTREGCVIAILFREGIPKNFSVETVGNKVVVASSATLLTAFSFEKAVTLSTHFGEITVFFSSESSSETVGEVLVKLLASLASG